MTKNPNNKLRKLAKLREDFVGKMDGRIADLATIIDKICDNSILDTQISLFRNLQSLAHKMAGSAGTFGFPETSKIFRQLEIFSLENQIGNIEISKNQIKILKNLIENLKETIKHSEAQSNSNAPFWGDRFELTKIGKEINTEYNKVIVVDDDVDFLQIIYEHLVSFGFEVTVLQDIDELEATVLSQNPSTVIMDVVSPVDDDAGVAVARKLKDAGILTCPIVFVSVREDLPARLAALRLGCDGYLVKPLDFFELAELMERLTKKIVNNPLRVLIVDDDSEVAEYYSALLTGAGASVVAIIDPMQTLNQIQKAIPDVILLDIQMPGCNGFELAQAIRQSASFVHLPIIFLTGSNIEDAWLRAMASGADEFLRKGLEPNEFVAVVLGHANRSRDLNRVTVRLQESEERFRFLAETANEGIMTMNDEGRIIYWSKGAELMLGFSAQKMIGISNHEFLSEQDRLTVEAANNRFRSGHKHPLAGKTFRATGRHEDGSEIPIEISIADWQVRNHRFITSIIRNITEQTLADEQLRRTQRLEAIGQLTGGIAHHFNNLLGIIIGNTEILASRIEADERANRCVKALLQAADRASSLTARLLSFSRQQILSPEVVDLYDIVGDLSDLLKTTLGEAIDLDLNFQPGLWQVRIDPHEFDNVLVCLAINAREAMTGGGKLTIKASNFTIDTPHSANLDAMQSGNYVKIAIVDSGAGMSPQTQEKAFEPFFTTKDVGAGSGLGLSMVYGFVKQSNGYITVESKLEKGSTVNIYLPHYLIELEQEGSEEEPFTPTYGTGRILAVEDNDEIRSISTRNLRKQGYEVIEAADGKKAVEILKEGQQFDLLFTDVILPGGMNGVEIAEIAIQIQPGIKVLYTTGYAESAFINKGILNRKIGVLNKPYRKAELLKIVDATLNSKPD